MAKRKQSGFSAEFQEQLLLMTKDSPLLAAGSVQNRYKTRGKTENREWELYRIEVRGCDGRMVTVSINDPANVPPIGEFVIMPVYVNNSGFLREARQVAQETF